MKHQRGITLSCIRLLTLSVAACLAASSCASDENGPVIPPDEPATPPTLGVPTPSSVYMTISGGGFRTHSAQAAWLLGMMESSGKKLAGITENVGGLSSNSGGSWFLTQLAYSDTFRASLEAPDAMQDYASTGYLGQLRSLLNFEDPCPAIPYPGDVLCRAFPNQQTYFAALQAAGGPSLNWGRIARELVFGPMDLKTELDGVLMNDTPQEWAADKSIIIASAMLAGKVVLTEIGVLKNKQYVSADPTREGVPSQLTSTPVFFSSMGTSGKTPPDFFSAGPMALEWSSNSLIYSAPVFTELAAKQRGNATVIGAATASSAVAAPGASMTVVRKANLPHWIPLTAAQISYTTSELAPAYRLGEDRIELLPAVDPANYKDLATTNTVRLADGVYNDNTTVAYTLRLLADNDELDGFEIIAFQNTDADPVPTAAGSVSPDIGALFGLGVTDDVYAMCGGVDYCISTRSPQVFPLEVLHSTPSTWSYFDGTVTLNYYRYEVVTVEQKTFGIPAGHKGTLHAFTMFAPGAGAAPVGPDDLDAYENLMRVIFDGVTEHGGWQHLQEAFQIE